MENKIGKHYDDLYSSEEVVFGGGKPLELVEGVLDHIKSGKVLDIGGGEGRNSIFLAKKGFDVEVIDLSKSGIEKINDKAKELNLVIKTKVADIIEEGIDDNYDLIISSFMLHHLSNEKALSLIYDMQDNTNVGGFNIIATFTKEGDFYKNKPESKRFFPELGEIRELYKDWDIIEYKEEEGRAHQKKENGENMVNVSALLLARKK